MTRNVLVFFTDQQRFDTTGVHGNPHRLTPHFDRMAREGVHIERSFTCQPVCAPSRASLQTGRYPTAIGCFRNGIPLPAGEPTLAHRFAAAGYETAYMGKWHLADDDVAGPVRPEQRGGYERWLTSNLLEFTSDAYETTLFDERGEPHELPGYRADALTDAAIAYLRERRRDRPFFLFLSYLEPHHQNSRDDYPAPHGYAERYPDPWLPGDLAALDGNTREHLAGYYGMVRRVDECLGRIRAAVAELGLADDTVVLYTSDHGCHFKTRNNEYKRSCHDASIRVPTAFAGPGVAPQPVRRLVSHLDLPPTLLDAAGLAVPPEMDGRSLLSLVRGEPDPRPDDVLVQISESQVGRALRTPRWKYAAVAPGADGWTTPAADRYVDSHLYDLQDDPHELHNLVDSPTHREVLAELRTRLADRIVEAGEPRPAIEPLSGPAPDERRCGVTEGCALASRRA